MKIEIIPQSPAEALVFAGPNGARVQGRSDCIIRVQDFENLPQVKKIGISFPNAGDLVITIENSDGRIFTLETGHGNSSLLSVVKTHMGDPQREYLVKSVTGQDIPLTGGFSCLPWDALRISLFVPQEATAPSS